MTWDRDAARDGCSVARTLEVVGERWTLLVLREAFYGVRRFDAIQRGTGAPRNVLTARLRTLVERGVMKRVPYREEGARQRDEYALTDSGKELLTAVIALMDWGDRHLAPEGAPVVVRHRDCGAQVTAQLVCADGHTGLTARETTPENARGEKLTASR